VRERKVRERKVRSEEGEEVTVRREREAYK
jgi:hypothetical protein